MSDVSELLGHLKLICLGLQGLVTQQLQVGRAYLDKRSLAVRKYYK